MGAQTTSDHRQSLQEDVNDLSKHPHHADISLNVDQLGSKHTFEFKPKSYILEHLNSFRQEQTKYECQKRIKIIDQIIENYDSSFEKGNNLENNAQDLFQRYKEQFVIPSLKNHEQLCFACTGRHWEVRQWNMQYQQVSLQEGPDFQMLKFIIRNHEQKADYLEVIIYKYLKLGNGYLKSDKVRNMKIFKKPLSQLQLTNLIFQHQYLVVECENSYWSFEKDTKRLIIQASVLLSDVRDKVLGEKRLEQMTFTWLGLRKNWYPEVMYESNDLIARDISEVRVFAQHITQTSLKYNVFKANCKIYAQYIMKNCITQKSWQHNQTFFDFFHT